jgi:hypothetical protein
MPRGQVVAAGELRVTGFAATEQPALGQKLWASRAMDRSVDAAAAKKGGVGGIHDGVHVEAGDVASGQDQSLCHSDSLPHHDFATFAAKRFSGEA